LGRDRAKTFWQNYGGFDRLRFAISGFIKGDNRLQATLFPEQLDDYISEDNLVRVIDVFVDSLKLKKLGFATKPKNKGRLQCSKRCRHEKPPDHCT